MTLLSEVETPASYTGRSDAFFYSLVYDPHQKSLVADRGEIRIGSSYQATVAPLLQNRRQREADRRDADLDEMIWDPRNPLDKEDVEKYLTVAKSGSKESPLCRRNPFTDFLRFKLLFEAILKFF